MMSTNEINSGSGSTLEQKKTVPSANNHSPFENIEKQEDSADEVSGPDSIDCEDQSSRGVLFLEAILYIPMLMQSFLANLHRLLFLGEAVTLLFDKSSPLWLRRCQTFLLKPSVWPPPAFQVLVALTLIALVVHPDGFTWVLLEKMRNGFSSIAEVSRIGWDIIINEHGAILSSILALATFAGLFFVAYVLKRTLSPRKAPESVAGDKNNSGKSQAKKKKRKGGNARSNHRMGKSKPRSESFDCVDKSSTGKESSTALSSKTLQHEKDQRTHDITQKQILTGDHLPVFSRPLSPTSEMSQNVADQTTPSASDVSVRRDKSISSSTISDSQLTYRSVDQMTSLTGSGDLQRDVTRFSKSGNRAYVASQTSDQIGARKKNTRRGTMRKFACSDSFPKQTIDVSHNGSLARLESQHDNLKSSRSTFCRTVERHDKDRHPNRSSAVSIPQKETKCKDQLMSSSGQVHLNTTSSEYVRISSKTIQSSHNVPTRSTFPYQHRDAPAESSSQFHQPQPFSDSIQHQLGAKTMGENWEQRGTYPGSLNSFVRNVPAPPGLSHLIHLNNTGAATGIPFGEPSGSSLPDPLHPSFWKCHETNLLTRNHRVKENPFELSSSVFLDEEDRIDAELQELGGRMVGSILDF